MQIRIRDNVKGECSDGRLIRAPFKVGNPADAPRVIVVGRKVYEKAGTNYGGPDSHILYARVTALFTTPVYAKHDPLFDAHVKAGNCKLRKR